MEMDEREDLGEDQGPDPLGGQEGEVGCGAFDAEIHRFFVPRVDDVHGAGSKYASVFAEPPEKCGDPFQRALRCGEPDSHEFLVRRLLEPLQGEGEVHAALVPAQGVDLVDDDVLDRPEHRARPGGRQHEVKRFGSCDEYVGGMLLHRGPARLRRVPRPHG